VILPDSLGGHKYNGIAVISCKVDENLILRDIRIDKLLLYDKNKKNIIDFYRKNWTLIENPNELQLNRYSQFFVEFVKTVKVKKIEGVNNNANIINIAVRLE
jgi:hypothetical protein